MLKVTLVMTVFLNLFFTSACTTSKKETALINQTSDRTLASTSPSKRRKRREAIRKRAAREGRADREMRRFRRKVEYMPTHAKWGYAVLNIIALNTTCTVSGISVVMAAIFDSVPVASTFQGAMTYAPETVTTLFLGGPLSLVVDVIQTPIDLLNAEMDDGPNDKYDKAFKHIRTAYLSTASIANWRFSKGSYCWRAARRLDILFE